MVNRGLIKHYQGARKQDRRTPRDFFEVQHARFDFTLDGAATKRGGVTEKECGKAGAV